MTRIVAGQAGGRRLRVPPAGTRPTSERVREALFSILTHRLGPWPEQTVMDAFAGSGALGLEAASRGAGAVLLIDQDPRAVQVLKSNATAVGLSAIRVQRADTWTLGSQFRPADLPMPITVLFVDPPYGESNERIEGWLTQLEQAAWLAQDAVAVVERSARTPAFDWPQRWRTLTDRRYSDTVVHVGQLCGIPSDLTDERG